MDNEVVIHVRSEDDTDRGFASAKGKADKFSLDFVKTIGKTGLEAGGSLAGSLSEAVSTLPAKVGPYGAAIGAGIAAAIAPFAGAAISAGILGAAGGAGILGGVALAAKDPAVKSAAGDLADTVSSELKVAAGAFVPATLGALDKLKAGFRQVLPDLGRIFNDAARFVDPLVDGIVRGGRALARGLANAVGEAGPIFEVLGDRIGSLGETIGDAFTIISGGSEGASSALDDLFGALEVVITSMALTIRGLTDAYQAMKDFGQGINDTVRGWFGLSTATDENTEKTKTAEQAHKDAARAIEAQRSALQDLADELQSQTDPLFAVLDAQQDVTEAQSRYNKALKEHGQRSPEARAALARLGEAALGLNGKIAEAAGGFDGRLTPAMRTALRNAGLTAGQMDRLERELVGAKNAAEDWAGTYTQTLISRRIIRGPGGQNLSAGGGGRQAPMAHGGIRGAASGMIGEGLTWVGENGPELLDLPPGAQVHSNPDARRMAAGASGGGDGAAMPLTINLVVDGETLATAVLPPLQKVNRSDYGGDVTRMFPALR